VKPWSANPALALFASHDGSNVQAIVDACKSARLRARPCLIISNNSRSGALARAGADQIPSAHLSSATHPEPEALDGAILSTLQSHQAELVILAGYMKKLGPQTLRAFEGRILNSHPALLPRFGGKGMFGRAVHEAVLAAGETETGITIHQVDEEYDHGAIVAQCTIPILPGDDVETLGARSLAREHAFWVETLQEIIRLP
jgi:phosphoribosylglycinamide formyltransferase-1